MSLTQMSFDSEIDGRWLSAVVWRRS